MSDEYMEDPKAKTVAGFIEGLSILSKYMLAGMETRWFCTAEHDVFYVFVELSDCPEGSDDGKILTRLGFHASEADNWAYFT